MRRARLALAVLLVALGIHLAVDLFADRSRVAEPAQQVALMDLPPPPPPPPPEQPELEPEVLEEPEPQIEPEPAPVPNEPPPPDAGLGLDAEGGAGGDAFGLEARRGGRDLIGSAGSGTGRGNPVWHAYAGRLERELERLLGGYGELKTAAYAVDVRVWVGFDGRILRAELARSTGDSQRDRKIRVALETTRLEPPPGDMPQPVRLRIRADQAG